MSFEVFVQCFDSGEPAGLPRAAVREIFPVVEGESDPNNWFIRYDGLNSCHVGIGMHPADSKLIDFLCVNRPCAAPELWAALLTVMGMGNVVIYWPGQHPPLAASETTAAHLPRDMVESLGVPKVVRSVEEVMEAIRLS